MKISAAPNVLWALGAIYGVLVLGTLIAWVLPFVNSGKDYTELKLRIRTWWIMISLFSSAVVIGGGWAIGFFGFISFLAFKEYLSLIPTRQADHRVLFWAYLAIPLQYYWISQSWYGIFVFFIPVFLAAAPPIDLLCWIYLILGSPSLLIIVSALCISPSSTTITSKSL